MATPALERVAAALEQATEMDTERALETLEDARQNLDAFEESERRRLLEASDIGDDPSTAESTRRRLETVIDQRIRTIENREAYDGSFGAAMNPDDEDAP